MKNMIDFRYLKVNNFNMWLIKGKNVAKNQVSARRYSE